MPSVTTILRVAPVFNQTMSASGLPENTQFDPETGIVSGEVSGDSGTMVFTATTVTGEVTLLSIPFRSTSAVPETFVQTDDTTYNNDIIQFYNVMSSLAPVSAFTQPTVLTADQAAMLWTVMNLARRARTDVMLDALTTFAPAITNILFPNDALNVSQVLEITAVLTALRDVAAGTYSVTRNSDLRRRFRSSYLIGYIHRKLAQ